MFRPKMIFIDWNGTLSNSLFWEHTKNREQLAQWLLVENSSLACDWMRGQFTSEDIARKAAAATQIDYETIFSDLRHSCENMKFVSHDVPVLISEISKRDVQTAVATDNMDTFLRWTMPALGLRDLFDHFLVSHSLGVLKDDFSNGHSLFFRDFMVEHKLRFSDCLLIDDSRGTINTYSALGLRCLSITKDISLSDRLQEVLATLT